MNNQFKNENKINSLKVNEIPVKGISLEGITKQPLVNFPIDSSPLPIVFKKLDQAINIVQLQHYYNQFVIVQHNSTNATLDVGFSLKQQGISLDQFAIIGSSKMFISPPVLFNEIYVNYRTFVIGNISVIPILLCYHITNGHFLTPAYYTYP